MDNTYTRCSGADRVESLARSVFGINALHPVQRIVIDDILACARGAVPDDYSPCRIVLLPTGAGKSLCFMLPALLLDGPTLVVYPLLALIADQERRFRAAGMPCMVLRGGQFPRTEHDIARAARQIMRGRCTVMASPEVLHSDAVRSLLLRCRFAHVVIDEAHCVSTWGTSFRPAYLALGQMVRLLRPRCVSAFTATADERVLDDVRTLIFDGNVRVLRGGSDRANIRWYVDYAYAKQPELVRLVAQEKRPVLIFCRSRHTAERLAGMLGMVFGYDLVRFYHAGLTGQERALVERWAAGTADCILTATCAFGMGVSLDSIQTVIHYDPAENAIDFMQKSGRCGRRGQSAKSILLWNYSDSLRASAAARGAAEPDAGAAFMKEFAESKECKRKVLLRALDGSVPHIVPCGGCSVCDGLSREPPDRQVALRLIRSHRRLWTVSQAVDCIKNEFNRRYTARPVRAASGGKFIWTHEQVKDLLRQLEQDGSMKICRFPWKGRVTAAGTAAAGTAGTTVSLCPPRLHLLSRLIPLLHRLFFRRA